MCIRDRESPHTLVFYESPHRLAGLLADALAVYGDRPAALALEPADDGNLCSTAWHRYVNSRGYPAFLTLNRHAGDPAPPIVNSAAWQPQLPVAGVYRVEVYLPAHPAVTWACPTAVLTADSGSARYTVHHAEGATLRVIDQMAARDGWIDLGVYPLP